VARGHRGPLQTCRAPTAAVPVRPDGHVAARLRAPAAQASTVLGRDVDRALGRTVDETSEAMAG